MGWFRRETVGSLRWESIEPLGRGAPRYCARARVPGGWLVETQNFTPNCGGLTFVPDPEHRWVLTDDADQH